VVPVGAAIYNNEYQLPYLTSFSIYNQAPRNANQFQSPSATLLPPPVPGPLSQTSTVHMENIGNGVQTAWNPGFSTLSMLSSTLKQSFSATATNGFDRNLGFSTPLMSSSTLKQSFGATAIDGIDKKMLDRLGKGK
jgi:hypothetical protein